MDFFIRLWKDHFYRNKMADKSMMPCVIADSAAFLKNVDLENIAEKIFTITDVLNEIRDAATKQRLSVLPYQLLFREPAAESLKIVTEFAKKTGDFKSLSAVDLRVLALTHQLEKEFCDVAHVKEEPNKKLKVVGRSKISSDKEMAGFYFEKKEGKVIEKKNSESAEEEHNVDLPGQEESIETTEDLPIEMNIKEVENVNEMDINEESRTENNSTENKDDVDGEGWITPSNIKSVKEKMGFNDETDVSSENVKCACLTTDFAMQNVLIQMGLHVISVNGMLIKQARNYVQKCFGCFKETSNMEKLFCPGCGNKTLMKVAVTVGDDGTMQYHYPKRRKNFNIRGTKFSAPAPKGGRQPIDQPILVEDQKSLSNRLPKKHDLPNPLDPDYITRTSPFAMNDTNSRAFTLGHYVKNNQRPNPNENRKKKTGRKK